MEDNNSNKVSVHHVLAHMYTNYFVLFLFGVFLDAFFHFDFFSLPLMRPIGAVLLVLSTLLIFWAQKTGRELRDVNAELTKEDFCRGPYCYTRIPTQWGLFLLMIGFGIFANAFFVVLTTVISFLISKTVFMGIHDRILIDKFGDSYSEYKKIVRF